MKLLDRAIFREMEKRLQSADETYRMHGIPVVDYEIYTPYLRDTFRAALEVTQRKDRRRFRRICHYLKGIVSMPISFGEAGYIEQLQVCAVRFQPPPSKDKLPKWAVWYAAILVHEATHALIHARGIPYDEKHRERIERLCFKEQNRFLRRLGLTPESLAKLEKINSFNSEGYEQKWKASFWQHWRQIARRGKAEKARQREASGGGGRKA